MKKTQFKGILLLLLTALIWGSAFVAQSIGMESIGAFAFSGLRCILGVLVLASFLLFRRRQRARRGQGNPGTEKVRTGFRQGLVLGCVFFVATNLQQHAFYYSTSGKIAFITALYMFFVPLFGLFLHKRIRWLTWVSIILGFLGLYFLCINPRELGKINTGDVLSFLCAIAFAVHILLIERFGAETDGVELSCIQFAVCAVLSCLSMFLFEDISLSAIRAAAYPLLYAGIMSCGLAYTFQILGQKYTEATVASLLMCMESVFAVLCAAVLLREIPTSRELLGCGIMFGAILLPQIPESRNNH